VCACGDKFVLRNTQWKECYLDFLIFFLLAPSDCRDNDDDNTVTIITI